MYYLKIINYMEIIKWQIVCEHTKTYECEWAGDICDYAAV